MLTPDNFISEEAQLLPGGANLSDVINSLNDFSRIYNQFILRLQTNSFETNEQNNLSGNAGI